MFRIMIAALVVLAVVPAAYSQDADQPDTESGRYILRRVDDGLMRVDRETGATSLCRKRGTAWTCEAVADDRAAMEAEIDRLIGENAELAREIGRLQDRVARLEGKEPEAVAPDEGGGTAKKKPESLPSDEDIDKVMKTFEKVMRQFMDMARELRQDYEKEEDRF